MKEKPSKKGLYTAVVGTVLVILCCFTPILVITLGIVGLIMLTPYLDYVLLPALAVMLIVTFLSYLKYKRGCKRFSMNEKEENLLNKENNYE